MRTRPLAAPLAALLLLAGCGDPVVVLGDKPGTLRRIAGIPDVAGSGASPDALATSLNQPAALVAAADGTLYVADQRNARILVVGTDGSLAVLADAASCGGAPCLERPAGLALDATGSLLVADRGVDRVFRISTGTGAVTVLAGSASGTQPAEGAAALAAALNDPEDVAGLPDGRVLVAERAGNRVWSVDTDGTLRLFAGTGRAGFSGDGGSARAAQLNGPAGLATDGERVFIADAGNRRVRRVDLETGGITTVAGSGARGFGGDGGSATAAILDTPQGLALTPTGDRLFLADAGNHRVRVVDLRSGTIRTFAGTGGTEFTGELLDAGDTALADPRGVAVSARGFLYIADTGHHIVWRTPIGL